jgi:hypothetical protein
MKLIPLNILFPLLLIGLFQTATHAAGVPPRQDAPQTAEAGIRGRLETLRQLVQAREFTTETQTGIVALTEAAEKNLGVEHPLTMEVTLFAAEYFARRGPMKETARCYRLAVAGFEKRLGPEHPDLIPLLFQIGRRTDEDRERISVFGRAIAIRKQIGGPLDQETMAVIDNSYWEALRRNPDEDRFVALVSLLISAFSRGEVAVCRESQSVLTKLLTGYQGGNWRDRKARAEVVDGYLQAFENASGPVDDWTPQQEKQYVAILKDGGYSNRALEFQKKVWESRTRKFGEGDPRALEAMSDYAEKLYSSPVLSEPGQPEYAARRKENQKLAIEILSRSVKLRKSGAADDDAYCDRLFKLAGMQLRSGMTAEGLAGYERILAQLESGEIRVSNRVELRFFPLIRVYLDRLETDAKTDPALIRLYQARFIKRFGPFHPLTEELTRLLVAFYQSPESRDPAPADKVIEDILAAANQIPPEQRDETWKFMFRVYQERLEKSPDSNTQEKRLLAALASARQCPEQKAALEKALKDLMFFYDDTKRDQAKAAEYARELAERGGALASTGWLYLAFVGLEKKEFQAANEMVERFFATADPKTLNNQEWMARMLRYLVLQELGQGDRAEPDFAFLYARIRSVRSLFEPRSLVNIFPLAFTGQGGNPGGTFPMRILPRSLSQGISEAFLVRFRAEWEKEFGADDPALKYVDEAIVRQRRLVQARRPRG